MNANEPLRFGMIGAGAIAQTYVPAFARSKHAQLIAVADPNLEAAEAIAETAGCPSFASREALADAVECDAVVVCTPPNTHPDICIDFLSRGVNVLCEKPLAISSTEARRMIEAAAASGATLTMASKFRFVEDVVRAKSIVTSGTLGEIILFENAFTAHVDMSSRWNSSPEISGGGVLIDNGTHSVDIMRYFLGPLAELQVVEGKRAQGLAVDETVRVFARSVEGVMGSIDLSWSINKEQPDYLCIYGTQGTVRVGWRESKYRRSSDNEWITFGSGYDKVQAFCSQIDNFAKSIRGDDTLWITHEDALASVEVIETAYRALRQSSWKIIDGADSSADDPSDRIAS